MSKEKEIRDDQIRVIGLNKSYNKKRQHFKWLTIIVIVLTLIGMLVVIFLSKYSSNYKESLAQIELKQAYYEPTSSIQSHERLKFNDMDLTQDVKNSHVEIIDTTINDVPIKVYIPQNVDYLLHVGPIDKKDSAIVYVAQAADIRADNGGIVGAFVLKGEPLARGLSKKGYCAIIDKEVNVGVAENSPLFERATERDGYFFRQFAFVDNGVLIENKIRGKYVRRAICDYFGKVIIIESLTKESYHDFAQVLVDFGVNNAVSLVGGTAYGWAIDENGVKYFVRQVETGIDYPEAVDVYPCRYTYEATENVIKELEDEPEEDSEEKEDDKIEE